MTCLFHSSDICIHDTQEIVGKTAGSRQHQDNIPNYICIKNTVHSLWWLKTKPNTACLYLKSFSLTESCNMAQWLKVLISKLDNTIPTAHLSYMSHANCTHTHTFWIFLVRQMYLIITPVRSTMKCFVSLDIPYDTMRRTQSSVATWPTSGKYLRNATVMQAFF